MPCSSDGRGGGTRPLPTSSAARRQGRLDWHVGLRTALLSLGAACPTLAQPDIFENEVFTVRHLVVGSETVGFHLFSALVVNHSDSVRTFAVDIRTEADGVGLTNRQKQFAFPLQPKETRTIQAEYEIATPVLKRVIVRFGEAPNYYWRKQVQVAPASFSAEALSALAQSYGLYLGQIPADRMMQIRAELPALIRRSRMEEPVRHRLRELFRIAPACSVDYSRRKGEWTRDFEDLPGYFSENGISAEPFSIASCDGVRISAFVATQRNASDDRMPIIILLTGNPPGIKESQARAAMWFAKMRYRAVGVDRRITSRLLDTKAKFLTNVSDPVRDVLRLIDYFSEEFPQSKIGLMGTSAGAGEAKFAAAFDSRISATVLACGIASHDSFFKDDAWVPTYSGMIIFPELGLGQPSIGKLTRDEFFATVAKLRLEHHAQARQVFRKEFPFFEDLDPTRVTPLIVPSPLLIVSGGQDEQFKPEGVVEVDRAVQQVYSKYGLLACSDLYIEPRCGHNIDPTAGMVISAFFERWLR